VDWRVKMASLLGRSGDKEKERRDELLSAYLDGELDERERQALESRLSEEPVLRAELRAMHQTVSLMRELPHVAAPRNFILTESMVARPGTERVAAQEGRETRRSWTWAAPLLTAATTVVSLLFVVVLVGDLLLSGVGGMASAPAPAREQEEAPGIALEAAPSREAEAESLEGADLVSPPAPVTDTDGKESVEEPLAAMPEEAAGESGTAAAEPEMALEEEAAGEIGTATAEPRTALERETATAAARATQAPAGAGALPPATGEAEVPEEIAAFSVPTVELTVTAGAHVTPTISPEEPVVSEDELGLLEPTPKTKARWSRESVCRGELWRSPWASVPWCLSMRRSRLGAGETSARTSNGIPHTVILPGVNLALT